jgi:hypothetical protein
MSKSDSNHLNLLRDGQPDGINNKSNLKDWADYAKSNSYGNNKSQAKAQLDGSTAGKAESGIGIRSEGWQTKQKTSEGKCWSDSMGCESNETASPAKKR